MLRALMGIIGVLSVILFFMWQTLNSTKDEITKLNIQLSGCNGRISYILRDRESDNAVDNLTNDDLRSVPPGWKLPEAD